VSASELDPMSLFRSLDATDEPNFFSNKRPRLRKGDNFTTILRVTFWSFYEHTFGFVFWGQIRRLFQSRLFFTAFVCFLFGFVFFWQKEIAVKAACKILVKLTTGVNFTNILWATHNGYTHEKIENCIFCVFWENSFFIRAPKQISALN